MVKAAGGGRGGWSLRRSSAAARGPRLVTLFVDVFVLRDQNPAEELRSSSTTMLDDGLNQDEFNSKRRTGHQLGVRAGICECARVFVRQIVESYMSPYTIEVSENRRIISLLHRRPVAWNALPGHLSVKTDFRRFAQGLDLLTEPIFNHRPNLRKSIVLTLR